MARLVESTVYVQSIVKTEAQGIIVEASNGSFNGPPFVRFRISDAEINGCTIGKSYKVTIEETNG